MYISSLFAYLCAYCLVACCCLPRIFREDDDLGVPFALVEESSPSSQEALPVAQPVFRIN